MANGERLTFGDLSVDLGTRQAWLTGVEIALTGAEFLLLKAFVTNPGKIFTRDELLDKVWGDEFDGNPRSIDSHIKNLRKKIAAAAASEFIQSIRGIGYKFAAPQSREKIPTAAPLSNLPVPLTSFVGRVREKNEIDEALDRVRLLTLTGPAGSGKTRLALEAARGRVMKHAGGVWLVELAALADPNLVASTAAAALKLREEPARRLADTLTEHLRAKDTLLVLDNCEHLVDACAVLAETLLEACPGLRVLATSREALKIPGEQTYNVPPMESPSGAPPLAELLRHDAARLFIDRLKTVASSFVPTEEHAPAIAQICAQLEGIPLAIELAAGRARVMPVEQIAAKLTHRLALLAGGSRTALPRHRTLQGAIQWSYELLTEEEAALFARLAVFRGGFTLEAAEQICPGGDVDEWRLLDLLTRLVEKSLVTVNEGTAEAARYDMLGTIRDFAEEKLERIEGFESIQEKHANYFAMLAEAAEPRLQAPNPREWLSRLDAELENFRAAFNWCLSGKHARIEPALRMGAALDSFWMSRGYFSEGRKLLDRAIALGDGEVTPKLAAAFFSAGKMAWCQGDYPAAESLVKRALALHQRSGDKTGIARAHLVLGNIAGDRSDYAQSAGHYEKSRELYRELGDKRALANVLNNMGVNALELGDFPSAVARFEEALAGAETLGDVLMRALILANLSEIALNTLDFEKARMYGESALATHVELGDKRGQGISLRNLACALYELGETGKGRGFLREALEIFREIGDRYDIGVALLDLGHVALKEPDPAAAEALAAECVALAHEISTRAILSGALELAGCVACAQSRHGEGARLFGAADALRRQIGSKPTPLEAERARPYLELASSALTPAEYDRLSREGSRLPLDRIVSDAISVR